MDIKQAFSRLENLPRSRKALILVAVLIVICGSYWYFMYQPATQRITEIEKDIEQLDRRIAKYRKQVQELPRLRDNLDEQKRILAHAETLLPETEHAVEQLLAEIEQLGQAENIAFLSFDPGSTKTHDIYATRSLSITLEGPFHNLMRFFSRISSLNTLITIESLDLNPRNQQSEEITVSSSVRLFVYRALNKDSSS